MRITEAKVFLVCFSYKIVTAQTEVSRKCTSSASNGSTDSYMTYVMLVRTLYTIIIHVLLHRQTIECMSQMTGSKYYKWNRKIYI